MITTEKFKSLCDEVNASTCDSSISKEGVQIAIVAGPSVVIEIIVKKASINCNIPMDWHYVGGRGVVYAKGTEEDIQKAKLELRVCMPIHNLG